MPDVGDTGAAEDVGRRPRRLRTLTWLLIAGQALYWAYTMWLGYRRADDYRGYQWMAAFFSTPPFVVLTLPAFLLHLARLTPRLTFVIACLGVLIVPFAFWGTIVAAAMDAIAGR